MDNHICIRTTDTAGAAINIQIADDRIQALPDHCEATQALDLSDTVVLPQILDAHNHPLPYNLSSSKNLMGDHSGEMGHFGNRFQWNPFWRAKSDQILAQQKSFKDKNPGKACDLFYYASMLDVGAAVIQGFDPPYYESCPDAQLLGLSEYSGIAPGNIASLTFIKKGEVLKKGKLDFSTLDESDVRLSLHRGQAAFGDTDLMNRLRKDATPLNLSEDCRKKGVSKSVAPAVDGSSLEAIHDRLRASFPEIPDMVTCKMSPRKG